LTRPLPLGSSVVSVDGQSAPAVTRAVTSGSARSVNTLEVSSSDFSIRLASVTGGGRLTPLDAGQFLVIESRPLRSARSRSADGTEGLPQVRVSGFGFKANSDVRVFILPNWYLGAVPVTGTGEFAESLPVPSGIDVGDYTLQANGFTSSDSVRSISTGVKVTEAAQSDRTTKRRDRVLFAPLSDELTSQAKRKLTRLAKRLGSRTVSVAVSGYVQRSASSANDASLSRARAQEVADFLRGLGVTGTITARGKGVASQMNAQGRKVVIVWQARRPLAE
jgi:outer membrane protein OmpA-like peptidoglycan-associated protein